MFPLLRLFLTLVLCLAAFPAGAAAHLRIGVVFPLTGMAHEHTWPGQWAMDFAARELAAAGTKVELVYYDNTSTEAGSLRAAKKAIDDGVHAVIAPPWSSHALPIAPLLEAAGLPSVYFSASHPRLTGPQKFAFRICLNDNQSGRLLARYARQQGFEESVVIYDKSEYSDALKSSFIAAFESAGGKHLNSLPFAALDALDAGDLQRGANTKKRQVFFLPLLSDEARRAALAIKKRLPRAHLLIGDGLGDSFMLDGGNTLERIWALEPATEDTLARGADTDKFLQALSGIGRQGVGIPIGSTALGYDAVRLLAQAAQQVKGALSRESLASALRGIEFNGISGPIAFAVGGDRIQMNAAMVTINKGAIQMAAIVSTQNTSKAVEGEGDSRGAIRTATTSAQAAAVALSKGKRHALVIGINPYEHQPVLKTAENDARAVGALLQERFGFTVTSVFGSQATRTRISKELNRLKREAQPEDAVLIYYAGHGTVRADRAYWLPVDAEQDDTTNHVAADDITAALREMQARHVAIISDSCYSGALTRSASQTLGASSNRENFLANVWGRTSRVLLSSGTNEPVADGGPDNHSVFAYYLLKAMREFPESKFTLSELHREIQPRVAGKTKQNPLVQSIHNSGDDGGDFVFLRKD